MKKMAAAPSILFGLHTSTGSVAGHESQKRLVPVVAILDRNCTTDGITYPIPGNDDAMRAINLYCDLVSGAVLDGLQQELMAANVDVGESAEGPVEALPEKNDEPAANADDAEKIGSSATVAEKIGVAGEPAESA